MAGAAKVVKKVTDFHEIAPRKILGNKLSNKIHFATAMNDKTVADADNAKKAARTAEELAAEQRAAQKTQLAELDDEENRRIKKLITGSRGTRNYRGGPMFRGRASDSAGAAPRAASAAASSSPSGAVLRDSGRRGGLTYGGSASLL